MFRRLFKIAPVAVVLVLSAAPGAAAAAPQIASPAGQARLLAGDVRWCAAGATGRELAPRQPGGDGSARGRALAPGTPAMSNWSPSSSWAHGFGPVAPGQIADVAVHKNTAYLTAWAQPFDVTGTVLSAAACSGSTSPNPAEPGAAQLPGGA